ncbi:gas vesicle protein K [Jiangella aurantiaca]|uniref:Gas vesicle protein K n=1 Tax=Jiangella aurantiaca TaxID=2530373 RepID=A0A4R5AHZ9_9ACTN|nr:gas vesicle protein K [Jiangella aurantiaca]
MRVLPNRVDADADSVERDLFKLVLTVIELIRQLMERQALRRVDEGDLSDEQVEALGQALLRLDTAMAELRGRYGLTIRDLDLDLGPLGTLLGD